MSLGEFWYIAYAAVADFNCTTVEKFVKFVASWEIFY